MDWAGASVFLQRTAQTRISAATRSGFKTEISQQFGRLSGGGASRRERPRWNDRLCAPTEGFAVATAPRRRFKHVCSPRPLRRQSGVATTASSMEGRDCMMLNIFRAIRSGWGEGIRLCNDLALFRSSRLIVCVRRNRRFAVATALCRRFTHVGGAHPLRGQSVVATTASQESPTTSNLRAKRGRASYKQRS